MPNSIDIKENDILERSPELLDILLIDRTTNKPIFWATDNYEDAYGENYAFSKPILKELITGVKTSSLPTITSAGMFISFNK